MTIRRYAAALAAAAALLTIPATASAYWGYAECGNYYSAQACWVGDGYHGLIRTQTYLPDVWNISETCSKAWTQGGNIRTGSGCNYNTNYRTSRLSSTDPISTAYGYWGGSHSPMRVRVWGCTPSDEIVCNS